MRSVRFTGEEVATLVRLASLVAFSPDEALAPIVRALPELCRAESAVAFLRGARVPRVLAARAPRARDRDALVARVGALDATRRPGRPVLVADPEGPIAAIACPVPGEMQVLLGVARAGREPRFSSREAALLLVLAPVVSAAAASATALPVEALGARELEVARLAARGLGDREIASALGIGFATVRTHLRRAFEKLGVSRRTELARLALPPPSSPGRRPAARRGGRRRARGR